VRWQCLKSCPIPNHPVILHHPDPPYWVNPATGFDMSAQSSWHHPACVRADLARAPRREHHPGIILSAGWAYLTTLTSSVFWGFGFRWGLHRLTSRVIFLYINHKPVDVNAAAPHHQPKATEVDESVGQGWQGTVFGVGCQPAPPQHLHHLCATSRHEHVFVLRWSSRQGVGSVCVRLGI